MAASGTMPSLPSPVPGGVGLMARAMLLFNTLRSAEIQVKMTQEASTGGGVRIGQGLDSAVSCIIAGVAS